MPQIQYGTAGSSGIRICVDHLPVGERSKRVCIFDFAATDTFGSLSRIGEGLGGYGSESSRLVVDASFRSASVRTRRRRFVHHALPRRRRTPTRQVRLVLADREGATCAQALRERRRTWRAKKCKSSG